MQLLIAEGEAGQDHPRMESAFWGIEKEMTACWSMKNKQPSHPKSFFLVSQSSHWSVELDMLTATAKLKKSEATWQHLPEPWNPPVQYSHVLDSTPNASSSSQWLPTSVPFIPCFYLQDTLSALTCTMTGASLSVLQAPDQSTTHKLLDYSF